MRLLLLFLSLVSVSCQSLSGPAGEEPDYANIPPVVEGESRGLSEADTLLLTFLSQNFRQAAAASKASIEIPPYFQVAAQEITPLRLPGSEQFTGASARGNVYVRVDYLQPLIGYCQSASVTEQEVRMSGFPVVRRGNTVLKGTAPETVFILRGPELEVDGPHEIIPITTAAATR